MKSIEFITEDGFPRDAAGDEYDNILRNLLKLVNKSDNAPFGQHGWKFQGRNMGDVPTETVSSMLGMLGAKAGLNSATTRVPGYVEMSHALSGLLEKLTAGHRNQGEVDRSEIEGIAKTVYDWSKAAYSFAKEQGYYKNE